MDFSVCKYGPGRGEAPEKPYSWRFLLRVDPAFHRMRGFDVFRISR